MKRYDLINSINARATFACTRAVLPHMLKQKHGRIIVMSPPFETVNLGGRVAYSVSKLGMTIIALGLAQEVRGSGVTINALWPTTLVESFATINHNLGNESMWRKATIMSDCCLGIVLEGDDFTGFALLDEDYLRSKGVTDFKKYRCDPSIEPPKIVEPKDMAVHLDNVGTAEDARKKSKL
eukprot:TRINITY_DN6945_c0_g1_i2.p1 TRINITY_DN6945_c0_g1~~TRINITY_DN6945_c0_g1_i2.p1  ORF type:complete len:181 (-),score=24.79 TRINITY_DN6945_c0_g1_i2:29-571(-)